MSENEFGPGRLGQDPESHSEQLRRERTKRLEAAGAGIVVAIAEACPNVTSIRVTVEFDDGMKVSGEIGILGAMTREEALTQFPEFATVINDFLRRAVKGGRRVPKTRKKRVRKNPASYPVEKGPENGTPE